METLFVNHKSELSLFKTLAEKVGRKAYRTHDNCNCEVNNRRHAVVVISNNIHLETIIRCKICVSRRKEANNGNI